MAHALPLISLSSSLSLLLPSLPYPHTMSDLQLLHAAICDGSTEDDGDALIVGTIAEAVHEARCGEMRASRLCSALGPQLCMQTMAKGSSC